MRNKLINEINTLHDKLGLIVEKEQYSYIGITDYESVYSDILTYIENDFENFKTDKELKEYIKYLENLIKVENMKYYILCRRNGIESILKNNGVEQYFGTLEQAQEKAKEMRKLVSSADYFVEIIGGNK